MVNEKVFPLTFWMWARNFVVGQKTVDDHLLKSWKAEQRNAIKPLLSDINGPLNQSNSKVSSTS